MNKRYMVVGILVMLLFSYIAVGFGSGNVKGNVMKKIGDGGVKGFTLHGVIRINNDTDFDSSHGVVGGSGTQNDPYIISGWDIDAHGAGNAIYIGNTTAYFVVENCHLHNASYHSWPYSGGVGITLHNASNGYIRNNIVADNEKQGIRFRYSKNSTAENNTILRTARGVTVEYSLRIILSNNTIDTIYPSSNTVYGIRVYESDYCRVYNNTIRNSTDMGLGLYSSNYNEIVGNEIYNNGWDGIYVEYDNHYNFMTKNKIYNNEGSGIFFRADSTYNVAQNNTLWNNSAGIYIAYTSHNEFYNNKIINNGFVIYGDNITYSTTNITTNNTVNGKPVYYLKDVNLHNSTITREIGQLIMANVSNAMVKNLILNNTDIGTIITFSSNIIISNCTFAYNNIYGTYVEYSTNITIFNNQYLHNTYYGIFFDTKTYNSKVYNNSFYYNHGSGDVYDSSHVQAYDDGSNNYWNTSGTPHGYGNYWHDWANNNNTNDNDNDGIVDWPYKIDGSGNDSYPLKNPTYLIPPLAPRNLQAVAGNGYVNLTWMRPRGNGSSPITEYRIYRNGTFLASVPANQLYYNDTSVVNGYTYTYYVTANNSVGEGEKSNEVQATPEGAVPEFSTGIWLFIVVLIAFLGVIRFRKSS